MVMSMATLRLQRMAPGHLAFEERTSISKLVQAAIRQYLKRRETKRRRKEKG